MLSIAAAGLPSSGASLRSCRAIPGCLGESLCDKIWCGSVAPRSYQRRVSEKSFMLRIFDHGSRREFLRAGGISLGGLAMGDLLSAGQSTAADRGRAFGRAKSVIIFGTQGGLPQHETWDPKPDAPAEIRGEFGSIASKTPGMRVGELMPKTAQWTDRIAVLRAIVTGDNAHSSSGYQMLTGVPHQPLNRESALSAPPNLSPSMGALVRALRANPGGLPSAVTVPEHIWNDGNHPWPGQDAGFLGRKYDPWLVHCDPSRNGVNVGALKLPKEIPAMRFSSRRKLLEQVNSHLDGLSRSQVVRTYNSQAQTALSLLSASKTRNAFNLNEETAKTRDRYGRGRFAQSVLLARRLVESGVSLVQINWTRIKGHPNQGGWDTHKKHSHSLKSLLMPVADQCFSALLEDLQQRGLLDETLVVWFSEFGHTPKFNKNAGRDHWGHGFSLALAGGGIRGGVVHGQSDKHAAYPVSGVVRGADLIATVFHCLGYPAETPVHDPAGRPMPISRGKVIEAIV